MTPAAVLSILVTANTGPANAALGATNAKLKTTAATAGKTSRAVAAVGKIGALGAVAGLGYAVKKAADFEQQLDSLGAVSEASGKDMARFRKQAMKAGADTAFSAIEAAEAQTELAKGGLSVRNIMRGGLKSALALAAAGEMDLGEAASTTANAMKLFGLRGKDSMKVADALATAANRTTADVSDFAMALKMGGSVAKLAGMSLNETVVILEALAETGVKNSDAGTSMKAFFLNITRDSPKAAKAMKELGVDIFDATGKLKTLPAISSNLRQAFGSLTKEQFLNKAGTIAGSDAIRTLWAFYDAGPAKLKRLADATGKHGEASRIAAQKLDNFKGKLDNLKSSVENAAVAIGEKMLPTLTRAAEKITKVLNDPKLTGGEKFNRIAQMAADAFSAAIPKVAEAAAKAAPVVLRAFLDGFRNSSLWGKLVIGTFLLAKMGGLGPFRSVGIQAGGAMGAGMATGAAATAGAQLPGKFAGLRSRMAGIGKNVLGAALVMGIADAATKEGISGFTARFAQGASTATFGILPAPRDIDERMQTIVSKIQAWRSSGKLALNRPGDPANSIIKKEDLSDFTGRQRQMLAKMAELRNTATRLFGPGTRLLDRAWTNPAASLRNIERLHTGLGKLGNTFDKFGRTSGSVQRLVKTNLQLIASTMGLSTKAGAQAVRRNMSGAARAIIDNLTLGRVKAKDAFGGIKAAAVLNSQAVKNTTQSNFAKARDAIRGAVRASLVTSEQGLAMIRDLWVTELKMLGYSSKQAGSILQARKDRGKGSGSFHTSPDSFKQRGGMIVRGGSSTGDSVHALLERGEVVVNRRAVKKMGGPDKVNRLNSMVPRFQAGGIAGMTAAANRLEKAHFPYVWGGGHQASPAPFGPMDCSGAVSFVLQHGGVNIPTMVSGALAGAGKAGAGAVTVFANAGHTFMSINGKYFGTSGSNPGGGAGWFPEPSAAYKSGLAQRTFDVAGGVAGTIPRVLVDGPDGAPKALTQRVLDVVRGGAQTRLDQLGPGAPVGAGDREIGAVTGSGAGLMKQISGSRGWNFPDWWELDRRESSHGTDLVNPTSSARLRGQFMDFNYGDYGPGSDPAQNPSMAQQIWAMARYIKERYGNPTAALQYHNAHNFYAKGGTVGQPVGMQRGGARGKKGDKVLAKALKTIYRSNKPKVRSKALRGLLGRIDKIDLPPQLQSNLGSLEKNANVYGELASRAGQLTVEPVDSGGGWDEDGGGAGDGEGGGQAIPGVADGKTETEWLEMQLAELFKYRNAILTAEKIVVERRERVAKLMAQARKRLAAVTKKIQEEAKRKQRLEREVKEGREQLAEWREHPLKNRARIAALRTKIMDKVAKIHGITKAQIPRVRLRTALKDKIIPALETKRESLNQARGDMLLSLDEVQGPGSSMEVLGKLPALGSLGGQIFDVQMRLRTLGEKPEIKDFSTPAEVAEVDTASADLLAQLLREANLRTAVSEKHFDVFKNMPPYGGQFATGGVVPGPAGAPRMILAHGQETVTPAGGGGQPVQVTVVVQDAAVDVNRIRVVANGEAQTVVRREARAGGRILPGRGGG